MRRRDARGRFVKMEPPLREWDATGTRLGRFALASMVALGIGAWVLAVIVS